MTSAKIQRMSKFGKSKPVQDILLKLGDVPDEMRCKICNNRYEDPKLLPCLHTFCKGCLKKSLEKHGGVLYCPICPGQVRLSDFQTVDRLQSNFMLSNLIQIVDLKRGVSSRQCDSCDEGLVASSRCYECGDFLCDSCVQAHRRVRFTKQHRIVSVKNLATDTLTRTPSCCSHRNEAVKMFCTQCKKPVCSLCIVNDHDDHVLISLKEAIEHTKPKLHTVLVAARAKIPILQRKLKNVHTSNERLESKVDEVIKDIQATSARVLMAVKRREKDLYRMLRRIHDKKSNDLERRELVLQNELAQVLDSCAFADELSKQENEAMVLQVSEMTYARLRDLGGKEVEAVAEIHEDEIEYMVDEKPILDELRIYGKVMSREDKARNAEGKMRESVKRRGQANDKKERGIDGKEENRKEDNQKQKNAKQEYSATAKGRDDGKASVERKASWLQTLANPRALIRRLSFGGDEMDVSKGGEQSSSKDREGTKEVTKEPGNGQTKGSTPDLKRAEEEELGKENLQEKADPFQDSSRKRSGSLSISDEIESGNVEKQTKEPLYSPNTTPSEQPQATQSGKDNPVTNTQSLHDPESPAMTEKPPETPETEGTGITSKSHSILKHPPPRSGQEQSTATLPSPVSQTWTIRAGSKPSGAHSFSYLPTMNILTKNRRGRPREVEIQLESPDNSIVSAQILDHKNGTYTIFYCPLTPGEHNLYVNVGGKNIKHGNKVLNFYGKFGGMGAEELFLTRRALSCIRWQITPGFVEIKDKKIRANPDM